MVHAKTLHPSFTGFQGGEQKICKVCGKPFFGAKDYWGCKVGQDLLCSIPCMRREEADRETDTLRKALRSKSGQAWLLHRQGKRDWEIKAATGLTASYVERFENVHHDRIQFIDKYGDRDELRRLLGEEAPPEEPRPGMTQEEILTAMQTAFRETGQSARAFAQGVDLQYQTVREILSTGESANPRLSTLLLLCKGLGLRVEVSKA